MNLLNRHLNNTGNWDTLSGIGDTDIRDITNISIQKIRIIITTIPRRKPTENYGKMFYIVGRIVQAFKKQVAPSYKKMIDKYLFRNIGSWYNYWYSDDIYEGTIEDISFNIFDKTIRYEGQSSDITLKYHNDSWEIIHFTFDEVIGQFSDYINAFLNACSDFHTLKCVEVDMAKFSYHYRGIIVNNIKDIVRYYAQMTICGCTPSWFKGINMYRWYNDLEGEDGYIHYKKYRDMFHDLRSIFLYKRIDDEDSKLLFFSIVKNNDTKTLSELMYNHDRLLLSRKSNDGLGGSKSSLTTMLSKMSIKYYMDAAQNVGKNICSNPNCNNRIHNMNVVKKMGMVSLVTDNTGALCCSCHFGAKKID